MLGGLVVVVAIICFVMYSGGKIGVARPIKSCTGQVGSIRLRSVTPVAANHELVPVHKAAFLLPLEEAGRISGVVRTRFCARRGLRRSILHASSRQTCSKPEQWAWESIRRRRR